MAILTFTQQLESVQAAIAEIESTGQSYKIDTGVGTSRGKTRADLPALYKRETYLRRQVDRESRGGRLRVTHGTPQ